MVDTSNVRLFTMALVSALLSLVIYGVVYKFYKPNDGGLLTLIIAVGVFSILAFVDGYLESD